MMEIDQVIVGLLSTSRLMHIERHLIHVNLVFDHYFQFDHWTFCEFFWTAICRDHIGLYPTRCHVHIEGQRNLCRGQQLP